MSEYLTYAALKTDDFDGLLRRCTAAANKIGVRFEVPKASAREATTWIGQFDNGWVFALADPAVWELLDVFSKVSRDKSLPYLFGSTEGGFTKWSYEYAEQGQVLHRFYSDPSIRFQTSEYDQYKGDPAHLASVFGLSRIRLQQSLQQFNAVNVQAFHEMLGFSVSRATTLKFVIVAADRYTGSHTYVGDLKEGGVPPGETTGTVGKATLAFQQIAGAADQGFNAAARAKAKSFGAEGGFAEARDMVLRLQQSGQSKVALSLVQELLKRVEGGEFDQLSNLEREIRIASTYAIQGLVLFDLGYTDRAIDAIKNRALTVNRYVGPDHRAGIALRLGSMLVEKGDYAGALDPLRLCLAERPTDPTAWSDLARATLRLGQADQARQACLNGVASNPKFAAWRGLMKEMGLRETDLLPKRDEERSKQYRKEAKALMRDGRRVQALAKFRLSLHHQPKDLDCAWGVACAAAECMREGDFEVNKEDHEAIRLLEQVCFGNPTWPWSWGTLIEVLSRYGLDQRAQEATEAYARIYTTSVEDLLDVSLWLVKLMPRQGVGLLKILLERFIELRMRGVSTYDEARDTAKFKALATYGWGLLEIGGAHDAVPHLIEASKLDPNNADNWATLGEAHFQLKNWRAANKAVARGIKKAPNHPHLLRLSKELRSKEY